MDENLLRHRISEAAHMYYEDKVRDVPTETMRHYERAIMLQSLDGHWREHLSALDHLRQGIHLRGYAQKNPKQEYKREAFDMFSAMLDSIKQEVVGTLCKLQLQASGNVASLGPAERQAPEFEFKHEEFHGLDVEPQDQPAEAAAAALSTEHQQPYVREQRKIGRNEPCPCGSGKKYKHCHGKLT